MSATFSPTKRISSFRHALRGLKLFILKTHNAWIQLGIFTIVVLMGFYYDLSQTEWGLIILAAGLVIGAEAFNTAIEVDIDLTSPEYHPFARDTKDIAAGAVLISCATAVIIGICVFSVHL